MLVNNFAVDFSVDTGAEVTALPTSYAKHIFTEYTGKKMRATRGGGLGETDMKQTKPLSVSIDPIKIDAGV